MANQWFRLYSEFATDPKVQMLSEANQRRYIMLLCLRCGSDAPIPDDEAAFHLRITPRKWAETKRILLSKGLITDDNLPAKWDERQYVSDSSTGRVAKYREKMKQAGNVTGNGDVTPPNRYRNGAVTPPDTETDTDSNPVGFESESGRDGPPVDKLPVVRVDWGGQDDLPGVSHCHGENWQPEPGRLRALLQRAGIPWPDGGDLVNSLTRFNLHFAGKSLTESETYSRLVTWLTGDYRREHQNAGAVYRKPSGFEAGDAVGEEWLARRERERRNGINGSVNGFGH